MFVPRLFCGTGLGREWESQKTNGLQLKQLNGTVNYNSQCNSYSPSVKGRNMGNSNSNRLSHSALGRSRSMNYNNDGMVDKRELQLQYGYGNSLAPMQRNSRFTSSCVSKTYMF